MGISYEQLVAMLRKPGMSGINLDLSAGPAPVLEPDSGHEPLATGQVQKADPGMFLVRITSVRKRLLDEDNLCEKFHIDCLRYAGLLPDDDPAETRIQTTQRKTRKGEAEHTEITITKCQVDCSTNP